MRKIPVGSALLTRSCWTWHKALPLNSVFPRIQFSTDAELGYFMCAIHTQYLITCSLGASAVAAAQ